MTNTTRIVLEPVFVLHTRAYRNSSLIIELFSMRCGRITVIARSARGPRSRYRGRLQAFSPLLASWSGKTDLKSLGDAESNGNGYQLEGKALLCGFYLNELMVRLLRHDDPYPEVYQSYQNMLNFLEKNSTIEVKLRYFEKKLLRELGYGLPIDDAIQDNKFYRYYPSHGFSEAEPSADSLVFPGNMLLALKQEALETPEDLRYAKRLMRLALTHQLGDKPIYSRELL